MYINQDNALVMLAFLTYDDNTVDGIKFSEHGYGGILVRVSDHNDGPEVSECIYEKEKTADELLAELSDLIPNMLHEFEQSQRPSGPR